MTALRLTKLVVVGLVLSGCVTSGHGDLIDQRLAAVEADSKDQRAAIESQRQQLVAQLPKLDDKLKEVSETLEKVNQATHRTGADVSVKLDDLMGNIQQLRGMIEETQHRLDLMGTAEQQAQQDSDRKLAAAIGPQALAQVTAKEKALKLAPTDRSGLYLMAVEQLQQVKDLDVARELFLEYLRRYPKDPQAADAQYEVAQTYYQAGRFKDAAVAYSKVTDGFPGSAKACDARLGVGLSFLGLKLKDDAKAALDETLTRCSGKATIAKEARARLLELKKHR